MPVIINIKDITEIKEAKPLAIPLLSIHRQKGKNNMERSEPNVSETKKGLAKYSAPKIRTRRNNIRAALGKEILFIHR
jgi:hypothetical protein